MAGANYMGGRRNTVRVRAKDTDMRVQRSHFGKQRLAVLTKGLTKSGLSSSGLPARSGLRNVNRTNGQIPEISFSHAKRSLPSRDSQEHEWKAAGVPAYTQHEESIICPPPPAKRRKLAGESSPSSRSSTSHSSRLLRELDVSEPIFMRAEIKRLLSHPDLAGLSRTKVLHNSVDTPGAPKESVQGRAHVYHSIKEGNKMNAPSLFQEQSSQHSPVQMTSSPGTRLPNCREDDHDHYSDFNPTRMYHDDEDSGYAEVPQYSPHVFSSPYGRADCISYRTATHLAATPPSTERLRHSGYSSDIGDRDPDDLSRSGSLPSLSSSRASFLQHSSSDWPGASLSNDLHNSHLLTSSPRGPLEVKNPSFIERITAKYPSVAASIRSASSSSGLRLSPARHNTLSLISSPHPKSRSASGLTSVLFISDIPSRSPSPVPSLVSGASMMTLFDVVNGRLFEGSDPWISIKTRLDPSSPANGTGSEGAFSELQHAVDRRGVGYNICPQKRCESTCKEAFLVHEGSTATAAAPCGSLGHQEPQDNLATSFDLGGETAAIPVQHSPSSERTRTVQGVSELGNILTSSVPSPKDVTTVRSDYLLTEPPRHTVSRVTSPCCTGQSVDVDIGPASTTNSVASAPSEESPQSYDLAVGSQLPMATSASDGSRRSFIEGPLLFSDGVDDEK